MIFRFFSRLGVMLIGMVIAPSLGAEPGEDLFQVPQRIQADGRDIDVERGGHSAPSYVDFDRDGARDLIVTDCYRQIVRYYRNLGTDGEPRFGAFELFRVEKGVTSEASSRWCNGFLPQFVDMDRDQRIDVISGGLEGSVLSNLVGYDQAAGTLSVVRAVNRGGVYWFQGRADRLFARGTPLFDRSLAPILPNGATVALPMDMDGDGDLDLVAYTTNGEFALLKGQSVDSQWVIGESSVLKLDFGANRPEDGIVPTLADWDGDGNIDLIVGAEDGSVRLFRRKRAPEIEFEPAEFLLKQSRLATSRASRLESTDWGEWATPFATDWNRDGKMDLLIGDCGSSFTARPQQTAEEIEQEKKAREVLARCQPEWVEAYTAYRARLSKGTANADAQTVASENADVLATITRLKDEMHQAESTLADFATQEMQHGYVWLFLRK